MEKEKKKPTCIMYSATLPHAVFRIISFVICVSFAKQLLVLKDTDNEPISLCCCWCCCERYDVHVLVCSVGGSGLEKLTLILKIHNDSEDLFFFLLLSSLQNFNLSCIINDKTSSKQKIQWLFTTTTATRADFHTHTSNYSHIHSINLEFVAAPVSSKWE